MKELSIRFLTGLIGVVLLIAIVLKSGIYLSLAVYVVSLVGLREFYKAVEKNGVKSLQIIGYLSTTGLLLSQIYPIINQGLIIVITVIILLGLTIAKKNITIESLGITILGVLYIPYLLFHILLLRDTEYIWLVFLIAFGTDTFAYISGNLFGKTKLAPKISPNKTIEGSLGGILGSVVLIIIYSLFRGIGPIWKLMILAIVASILSQIGDLIASKIKRMANIKDFGFIMPGHGGVLDRFDSIIFSAPVIYYYIHYFII